MCHHTRPRRRAGCRHSRSRLLECLYIRTRRSHLGRCKRRKHQARLRSRQRHHVNVVTDSVIVHIGAVTSALVNGTWPLHPTSVDLIAVTVAIARRDAVATTHATFVKLVAVTVAIASWDAITTANATLVILQARAIVHGC